MTISSSEKKWEIGRLKEVIGKIERKIAELEPSLSLYRNIVVDLRRSIWENSPHHMHSFDDIINLSQHLSQLDEEVKAYQFKKAYFNKLIKLKSSPYFARIDFREDGTAHPEMIYIGIYGFMDDEADRPLIYDWRAPISSMFYDYGRGPAEYDTGFEKIKGEITLKRQYKIVSGHMEYMFDSDLKIDDEILQSILAKSADNRMRTIVTTIQREQNRIIRDDESNFLIVQGSAGSGKTSIALHRIAYLLYRHRGKLHSRNILILSPNGIFKDYISDVLPDLGEENVLQMTFREYALKLLQELDSDLTSGLDTDRDSDFDSDTDSKTAPDSEIDSEMGFDFDSDPDQDTDLDQAPSGDLSFAIKARRYTIEKLSEQFEYILRGSGYADSASKDRLNSIRLKSSHSFGKLLKAYLDYIKEEKIRFSDIRFRDRLLISEEELRQLFLMDYSFLPIKKRLKKIRKRILYLLKPLKRERYQALSKELAEDNSIIFVSSDDMKRHIRAELKKDLEPIYSTIRRMVRLDVMNTYISLFKEGKMLKSLIERAGLPANFESEISSVADLTLKSFDQRIILYEDIAPLLYLKGMIDGFPAAEAIRHLVIDEAQDYSPMQYQLMAMLFPRCRVTLLGDLNQSINPHSGITDYSAIAEIFGAKKATSIKLVKSYRSTKEIVEFTKRLLKDGEPIEPIDRPGEQPLVIKAKDKAEKASLIIKDIKALKDRGASSIAVICKTAGECKEAFDMISEETGCTLVTDEDGRLDSSTVVIPSYLSKGLEFDAVIIYDACSDTYSDEAERKLLYTACTRALHHLHLFHTGDITPLMD